MGSYINIFFLCTHSEQMRIWLARLSPWSGERFSQILKLLGIQLACISVWFVARMMFQLETNTILPNRGSSEATQAIRNGYYLFFAVYLVAIGFVITAAYRINSWSTRLIITGIAFLTSLFLGSAFMGTSFLQLLELFIGPQANAGSTAVFSMVLFVILLPLVVPNFFAASEDTLRQPREEDDGRPDPKS